MNESTDRLAVVIGNSNYENLAQLVNSANDAKAVKESLQSLGYEVSGGFNLRTNEILKCFKDVLDSWARKASEIVVYYSGHGISIDGKVYIGPVDADEFSEDLIRESFFSVEIIIRLLLKHRKNDKLPIVLIFDCCRSKIMSESTSTYDQGDPFQSVGGEFGTKANIAILYSTADGQVALDGHDGSDHSPYTQILLENIMKDMTIYEINNVITKTLVESGRLGGKQISWMYQSLYEPYRFNLRKLTINPHEPSQMAPDDHVTHPFYGVPAKNYNFIDRPDIFSKMEALLGEKSLSGENILALKGLGGMGKTQLMLQYCYIHRLEYNYIFWLEADGRITTLDSFRKLAINLGLDEESAKEKYTEEKVIDWVCAWLEKKTKWLLLLDNADEVMATELFNILPRVGGDIILTTREHIPSSKARVINVDNMDENEALSLLLNNQSVDQQNEKYAKEIVAELGSMPLAIVLACAYIDSMQISFKNYLSMFKNQRDEVFSHSDEDNSQYNHNLTSVWKLSFERVRTRNPVAGLILDVCAFLQPDDIPMSFFGRQYSYLEQGSAMLSASSLENGENPWRTVRAATAVLVKFSFVTRVSKEDSGKEEDFLTVHRLVQKAIFNAMGDDQKTSLACNIATALNNELKFSDNYAAATRNIINQYLPHIRHFVTLLNDINQNPLLSSDLQDLLVRIVDYLLDNGIYVGVESLAKLAVSISESIHGIDNLSIAKPLSSLARLYHDRSIYANAEPLLQRALAIREKTLGPEHPDTATSLNGLATLYKSEGKYVDAEPLCKRALAIMEKALGPDHLSTAIFLNNLASLYDSQSKYTYAEPLYQRALTIREKILGSEHPDTATSLNNLASLYDNQGKYTDAEPLYKRALAIREKALGPEHPDTATSLNDLALFYDSQGKCTDAEPLYQRALTIWEKKFGPDHPETATSLNNLASLYEGQGKYADAKPLYQRALTIREKALGPEHPDTAKSLNNLASFYESQGRYDDAEPLYQRALTIKEKALGSEHPSTANSLNNLALLYEVQDKFADARPLHLRALKIREKSLGPEHPDTVTSLYNLAVHYNTQGKYSDAEPLYQRALKIREKVLGPEHEDTAASLDELASFYDNQGKYADAEPLCKRALMIREKTLGPEHPHTTASKNMLASLRRKQGKNTRSKKK